MYKLLSHVKDVSVHSFELALGFLLIFARILVVPLETPYGEWQEHPACCPDAQSEPTWAEEEEAMARHHRGSHVAERRGVTDEEPREPRTPREH